MATYHFSTPLQEEDMRKLHVGDVGRFIRTRLFPLP